MDGKPVTNVQSFRDALNKADPKRGVLLYLDRKGNKTFAVLKARRASFSRLPTIKQDDPADQANAARNRRKSDSVTFLVGHLKWSELRIFFWVVKRNPPQAKPMMPMMISIMPTITAGFISAS